MHVVVAEKLMGDGVRLFEQFLKASELLGLVTAFTEARSIFIKPNLTFPYYREAVTTRAKKTI